MRNFMFGHQQKKHIQKRRNHLNTQLKTTINNYQHKQKQESKIWNRLAAFFKDGSKNQPSLQKKQKQEHKQQTSSFRNSQAGQIIRQTNMIEVQDCTIPIDIFLVGDKQSMSEKQYDQIEGQRSQTIMSAFMDFFIRKFAPDRVVKFNKPGSEGRFSFCFFEKLVPKKICISGVKYRLNLKPPITMKQIIQSKYKADIDLWRQLRHPKLFILMTSVAVQEDISLFDKFLKDVDYLYSRKTVNIQGVREKMGFRKRNPNANEQKKCCNWVTGILVNDIGGFKIIDQKVRQSRTSCLELCKNYDLLYKQTNVQKIKQNKGSDLFTLIAILKLTQFGFTQNTTKSINNMKQYLEQNMPQNYQTLQFNPFAFSRQKQKQMEVIQALVNNVKEIVKKVQQIKQEIRDFVQFVRGFVADIYEYGQSCTQQINVKIDEEMSTQNYDCLRSYKLAQKLQLKLSKSRQRLYSMKILQMIISKLQLKNKTRPRKESQQQYEHSSSFIANNKSTSSLKLIPLIIEAYKNKMSAQIEMNDLKQSQILSRISSLHLKKSQIQLYIYTQSQINLKQQHQMLQEYNSKQKQQNMQNALKQKISKQKQLSTLKKLFKISFESKIAKIKSLLKFKQVSQGEIPQICKDFDKSVQNYQENKKSFQKSIDIKEIDLEVEKIRRSLYKYLEDIETEYQSSFQEVQKELKYELNLAMVQVFEKLEQINTFDIQIVKQIKLLSGLQDTSIDNELFQKMGQLQQQKQIKEDEQLLNQYLTQFYLRKIYQQLTSPPQQSLKHKSTYIKQSHQKFPSLLLSNAIILKLSNNRFLAVLQEQLLLIFKRYDRYSKCTSYLHTLEVLNQLSGSRKAEYEHVLDEFKKNRRRSAEKYEDIEEKNWKKSQMLKLQKQSKYFNKLSNTSLTPSANHLKKERLLSENQEQSENYENYDLDRKSAQDIHEVLRYSPSKLKKKL